MPAPRWVAHANKIGLNRLTRFIAPWAPGWAVVIHRGRKSGRIFRTPLWAFKRPNGYVIALTYGRQADWVRNVLAAGGCELETRRHRYRLTAPQVYQDKTAADMPVFIRFILRRVIKAPEFLNLEIAA
ncbi:nitroreductase family deazaflavin-dependent oxidoreductase [Mycobacterium sp. 141]|uniref:nitroreductase family deazaflavin-dependent oxidoreductase n=1 Tax=Mycobacterium sp. 141 TaxID=1120797 RepID=UPI00036F89CC|nr:nitroreductase family deazaflavin-dependent oxidoreductase [Mycobacterium sp. 141]